MRYRLMVEALLAAVPAAAAPDSNAFLRKCRPQAPVATCTCMVNKMLLSRDGQITLDAFRLAETPEDQKRSAVIALADKYDTTLTGIQAAVVNAKAAFETYMQDCL
jgi:hypothetical protein